MKLPHKLLSLHDLIALLILLTFLFPEKSHAYLDPGTGSVILQLVIASVLGAIFTLKMYWRKFLDFFSGKKSDKQKDEKRED